MNDRRREPAAPKPVDLMGLLHAAYAAQDAVEARLAPLGLSLAKLAALSALAAAPDGLPLGQLAERLSCVKSNITQLVDRLEADGFVARAATATDRRTKLAVLTPAGRKAWADGVRVQQEAERELLGGLNREESRQLAALLEKVGARPA
jgi:DNA-binding MarR family transcriptional regulator